MNIPVFFLAQAFDLQLAYIWNRAPIEGKAIIGVLVFFSIFAWSTMASKAIQMRRAKRMNFYFRQEFQTQNQVLAIYDRRVQVEGCPLFAVYEEGCMELNARLKNSGEEERKRCITLKGMEHVKGALERAVSREALKLESGLILLAIAVSGSPFLGLLGTVWGVMRAFGDVAMRNAADLPTLAPGVAAALITTVAGLLVAIPSMFGYNWLVHNLRVMTVELDNFAQQLASRMETEFLPEDVKLEV